MFAHLWASVVQGLSNLELTTNRSFSSSVFVVIV